MQVKIGIWHCWFDESIDLPLVNDREHWNGLMDDVGNDLLAMRHSADRRNRQREDRFRETTFEHDRHRPNVVAVEVMLD